MQLDSIKAKTFRFRKLVSLEAILTHKDHSPAVYRRCHQVVAYLAVELNLPELAHQIPVEMLKVDFDSAKSLSSTSPGCRPGIT